MNKIVDDILEILEENELIQSIRVVNYDETPSGRLEAKLRSQLPKNHTLQIWIHIEPESLDYAYQLFTSIPLLRWDNSPHYGNLPNAPHHFHDENGMIERWKTRADSTIISLSYKQQYNPLKNTDLIRWRTP